MFNFLEQKIKLAIDEKHSDEYPLTRFACYSDLKYCLKNEDSSEKTCLSISNSERLAKVVGLHKTIIINKNYPEIDINELLYGNETFNFVVSDFVIEHINSDPLHIFKEQSRILTKGGYIVCTTAFVYPFHICPVDLWRFSKQTFEYLCKKTGLEIVKCGSWGSIECLIAIHLGYSDEIVPVNKENYLYKLATEKDERYQIVTWLVARKK